jgi:peptidyl-prolyl cis-trans isomerase C
MRVAAQKVLADYWLRAEIAKSVTREAIDKAYDAYVSDTASREEVKASHILVADEQTAINAIQKLEEGADFAELAREISTGPSGPNGGDLGYFGRGAMVPVFEQAAFALGVGSFTSAPVQSQFGWHVIKLHDKRIAEAPSIEEMSPQLELNISNLSFARLVETLRADAKIQKKSLSDIEAEWQESQESLESSTQ